MIEILSLKKKHLVVLSAVIVSAVVTIAGFLIVFPPKYEIAINPVDPADMGVEDWLEDFQFLYSYVENNYPYLDVKNRTHGFNWLDLKESFEDQIHDAQNNREFLGIIAAAVKALQNRHTHLLSPSRVVSDSINFENWTPMNEVFSESVVEAAYYWDALYNDFVSGTYGLEFDPMIVYDQGDYVVHNYNSSWGSTYGDSTVITHVNGIPVDEAIMTCYEKEYIDYDFYWGKSYLWSIYPRAFGHDAIFTIRNSTGYVGDVSFSVVSGFTDNPYEYPGMFNATVLESESIGYLYVGSFGSNVDQYYDDVISFYQQIEDFDHLIIDIRGNTGGFYSKWIDGIVRPLIHDDVVHTQHLAYRTGDYVSYLHLDYLSDVVAKDDFDYLPSEVLEDDFRIYKNYGTYTPLGELNFNGDIVVLTDNMVYSAAEGFVNFCREYNFAKIYGTSTGGDGIMLWPLYFVLPNSKLVINSASALGLDETGHANEEVRTQPDVFYESAFGNWNELIDFTIEDLLTG